MKQKVLYPKVVRGGKAVPLGNNFYYMSGRKHKDGGIDVGENPRTGLEVEDEEVMHITKNEAKVFSSVPFLNGKSPADKVLDGENSNKVFKQQEDYKDRKGLNDDGTNKKEFGGKTMIRKKSRLGSKNPNDVYGVYDTEGNLISGEFNSLLNNSPASAVTPSTTPNAGRIVNAPYMPPAFDSSLEGAPAGTVYDAGISSTGKVDQTTTANTTTPKNTIGNILSGIKTGVSKAGNAAWNYAKENPSDAIGIGGNVIGGLISAGINKRMLKSLKYANAPAARQATKLKTTININPQLDKMRETLASYERDIDGNTASSRVGLARKQRARLASMLQTNELYGAKENAETELINKDRLNQQATAEANLQNYNRWSENKTQFDNAVREKRSENKVGVFETINAAIQDGITRGEKRFASDQNIRAIAAGNPNVNPEILEELGIKMPKKLKEQYQKVYGKKGSNKD